MKIIIPFDNTRVMKNISATSDCHADNRALSIIMFTIKV